MKLRVELPPEGTTLNYALRTALLFLASYMGVNAEINGRIIEIDVPSEEALLDAVNSFIDDLAMRIYGLEPSLAMDRGRLGGLAKFLGVGRPLAHEILDGYRNYLRKLHEQGKLLDELQRALSRFEQGYPEDRAIHDVPLLNRLAPEFMEGMRALGGVGLGSVPAAYQFRQYRIGPHSACLGIAGLWTALAYTDGTTEYYVFPSLGRALARAASASLLQQVKESQRRILGRIRGRPLTSPLIVALIIALSTAGASHEARGYELLTMMSTGRRAELVEAGLPLSSSLLFEFADRVAAESEDSKERLVNFFASALSKAASSWLQEAALKTANAVFLALECVIPASSVAYVLGRYVSADTKGQTRLRRRDIEVMVKAIESVKAKAWH